jgi:hypothetical protein
LLPIVVPDVVVAVFTAVLVVVGSFVADGR